VLNTYEHATKLCQVKDYPIGVASWGIGSVGARTVASIVAEFSNSAPKAEDAKGFKLKGVADGLFGFIMGKYLQTFGPQGIKVPSQTGPALGILIAGYGDREFFPEQYVALLPLEEKLKPARGPGTPEFGANWYGLTDAILRLYKGFAPELRDILIKEKNWLPEDVDNLLSRLEYPVIFDGMPLQDAIDFAVYLIGVVIGRFRFVVGPPVCGGQIDVAVITPGSFGWVQKKTWRARPLWHAAEEVRVDAQGQPV
jgi:hypothetical protein